MSKSKTPKPQPGKQFPMEYSFNFDKKTGLVTITVNRFSNVMIPFNIYEAGFNKLQEVIKTPNLLVPRKAILGADGKIMTN